MMWLFPLRMEASEVSGPIFSVRERKITVVEGFKIDGGTPVDRGLSEFSIIIPQSPYQNSPVVDRCGAKWLM